MEQKPTSPNGDEPSLERREELRRLAESLGILLAAPLITAWTEFLPTRVCVNRESPKEAHMNRISQQPDDPFRLPRHVLPTRYDLRLEPDLAVASFAGRVTIALTVVEPTDLILLNALELDIKDAVIDDGHGKTPAASVVMDEAF